MGSVFGRLYSKKEYRVLMQGLDAAGKTTILYRMKLGEVVTAIPTVGFNVETLTHRNITFTTWDVGGGNKMRPLVRQYYPNTAVLVYVVNSADEERMVEVKEEMDSILWEDELRDVPILIYANKQDLSKALSVETIIEKLQLHNIRNRTWHIVPCVAITGDGLSEGFDWMSEAIKNTDADGHVTFEEVLAAPTGSSYFTKGLEYVKKLLTT